MSNKLYLILKLKFLQLKRALNKVSNTINTAIASIIALFLLLFFTTMGYFSDVIIKTAFSNAPVKDLIFQGTIIFTFILSISRFLISQNTDDTALNLYKLGNGRKSTAFFHILFNIVNIKSLSVLLMFVLVGVKNFLVESNYLVFYLYLIEIILSIGIFEFLILSFRQYFLKEYPLTFLISLGSLGLIAIFMINKFGFPLPVSSSLVVVCLLILFPCFFYIAYKTTNKYLEVDSDSYGDSASEYWEDTWNINPTTTIFIKYMTRIKFLRNYVLLFLSAICISIYFLFFNPTGVSEKDAFYLLSFGCIYSIIYIILSYVLFSPDYRWIGFLHSGNIKIKNYMRGKLVPLQLFYMVILLLHIVGYIFYSSLKLEVTIMILIFYMGTVPYLLSWLEIKFFTAKEHYKGYNRTVSTKMAESKYIPILVIPILYILVIKISFNLSMQNIINNYHLLLSPLTFIGMIGLILHPFWIKKLAKYYGEKRFEIFEKSEAK